MLGTLSIELILVVSLQGLRSRKLPYVTHAHGIPILYCLTYFSHLYIFVLPVFKSFSVLITSKVQDTALCLVVWDHWYWVLCVGEELDEERPVNLKEPIQLTRGY